MAFFLVKRAGMSSLLRQFLLETEENIYALCAAAATVGAFFRIFGPRPVLFLAFSDPHSLLSLTYSLLTLICLLLPRSKYIH